MSYSLRSRGLSFQELAHRSEIETSNLVRITTDGTNVTATTLYKISKGLGVEPKELLDF
ncbi:MAG: transcriptional regulator [Flavobacteriales bacterium]|nr:MAG: transcriptional regulator [Flavobacteriales bacterium]